MGTAVRRIPPDTQGWAVALLASRPWTRRPGAHSAHHPGTGPFSKGILGGVLTTQACSPSWNPIGQSPGAQRRLGSPSPTGLAQSCSQACLGLACAPVGPVAAHV